MSTAEKLDNDTQNITPMAVEKPKKNTKATEPELTDEEKAQLAAELAELTANIKATGDMRWDDELHYGWADDATAKRLHEIQAHNQGGNTLAWDPTGDGGARGETGAWRTWDGNRWTLDTNNKTGHTHGKTVARLCREMLDRYVQIMKNKAFGQLDKFQQDEVKNRAAMWGEYSKKVGNAGGINAGLALLRSEPGMTPDVEWDSNPNLLATPCGTIELSNDFSGEPEIHDARREDWITRSTAVGLDTDERGGRTDYNATPKRFEKLLEESLPSPDVRRYFQKCMGYTLFGANNEQKLIVLWGKSGSGKTTIMQIIAGALGEYAKTFGLSLFRTSQDEKARPDIVKAMKTRLIYASETSKQWSLDADQLKRMTGGDTVEARLNHGNKYFEGVPAFTPVLATNTPPTITGVDEAVWRRLIVIWFPNPVDRSRVDKGLSARIIAEEGPAILGWLLDGYRAYSQGDWIITGTGQQLATGQWVTHADGTETWRDDPDNATTEDFGVTWVEDGGTAWIEDEVYVEPGLDDMPADVINATMRFRGQLSSSDEFINSDAVTRDFDDRNVHERLTRLYDYYKHMWCPDNGISKPETLATFKAALDRHGHVEDWFGLKTGRYRARVGVMVRSAFEGDVDLEIEARKKGKR